MYDDLFTNARMFTIVAGHSIAIVNVLNQFANVVSYDG